MDIGRQSGTYTHKECVHFNKGFCILSNTLVNPDQAACPRFKSKHVIITSPTVMLHNLPPQVTLLSSQQTRKSNIRQYSPIPIFQSLLYAMSSCGAGGGKGRRESVGRGARRKGILVAGSGKLCVCPKCCCTTPHMPGLHCYQHICPKYGTPMIG